jgi:class 3 adenylate cyclase
MLEPRGWLARLLARWEIGVRYRRKLDKVYRRLDRLLAAGAARPEIDLIDPEIAIPAAGRARVAAASEQLIAEGAEPRAVESLAAYLTSASDQDVARIRPLELAARFAVPEDAMLEACLRAAKQGLVGMVWDVICPSCRIPSSVIESLAKIEEHARCKACNVSFSVDFSRAIELAFRASSEIRAVETQTFCIGGPAHFPHIAAQVRLAPGERFALALTLGPGFYLLRSPQLPRVHELRVTAQGGVRRLDVLLGERTDVAALTAGDQLLTITNPEPREVLVRVERAGDRAFALTAARVMATAAFRELFPDQQLAPGRLMAVTQTTLVVAQVDDAQALFRALGDSKAFPVAARFFDEVGALAREYGGSLVKTFGGLAIAAFERPGPAVEAALALQAAIDAHPVTTGLACRIAVHRGPMMALTQGGRLDYFGQNVEQVLTLAAATPPDVVALTQAVCQDVGVAERLQTTPDQLGLQALAGGSWVLHVRAQRGADRALPAPGATAATIVQ